ncbi:MAG: hypothetical protein ACREX6_07650, partial [Casimicrobiaceae bacterium]
MPNRGLRTLRAIDLACAVLVIVGAVRLFALVLHMPLLGYANQYDMARSSACVDLWPALPSPARYAAHQAAPLPRYEVEHVPGGPCYPSSVLAFVELAKGGVTALRWAWLIRGRSFPLQAVGIAEAVALIALMLAFIRAERDRPRARLAHAALFALILSDPAMALWMNTLYTEFATIFFAYATGGLLALAPGKRMPVASTIGSDGRMPAAIAIDSVRRIPVASDGEPIRHRGYLFSVMWIGALAGLAWSRQQYAAFVFVPLLIAAPQWWRCARGGWFTAVIVLIASVAMQASFMAGLPAVRAANDHDFYLGAVLPAARNEDAALTRLGLPHACRA